MQKKSQEKRKLNNRRNKHKDRQDNRQIDIYTDRQADRQTGRQTTSHSVYQLLVLQTQLFSFLFFCLFFCIYGFSFLYIIIISHKYLLIGKIPSCLSHCSSICLYVYYMSVRLLFFVCLYLCPFLFFICLFKCLSFTAGPGLFCVHRQKILFLLNCQSFKRQEGIISRINIEDRFKIA